MQPDDVASLGAAQSAFLALLAVAEGPAQLEVLGSLLAGVWRNGDAFLTPKVRNVYCTLTHVRTRGLHTK